MVPSTVVGLLVLLVVVIPGLAYTLAFERQVGNFGVSFADRTFRFIAGSVVYHLLFAWPEYGVYRAVADAGRPLPAGAFALLWTMTVVEVAVPWVVGSTLGKWHRDRAILGPRRALLHRLAVGSEIAPRAWDHFFADRPATYLRVHLTDGRMIAGAFADGSYAGGFPNDADLLIESAWRFDPETKLLTEPVGHAVYVPASQIALVEIVPTQ